MNTRLLIVMMSILFVVGLSVPVSADWVTDTAIGEKVFVPGYDLDQGKVSLYGASTPGTLPHQFAYVGVRMKAGSKLPGIMIFEFDLDNNAGTGGNVSMAGIFNGCGSPSKIKIQAGIDISITLILRDQGQTAPTAWCYQCLGSGGNCFLKNTPCPGCGTPDCYKAETPCAPGVPNCYLATLPCQPTPGCTTCYEMVEECSDTYDCGIGRVIGEWYVTATAAGTGVGLAPPYRGRIDMPLPVGTDNATVNYDYYLLPWRDIVLAAYTQLAGNPKRFNLANATDPTNVKWQVSSWYDPDFATSENDFMNIAQLCLEITDVIPNVGLGASQSGRPADLAVPDPPGRRCEPCEGNFDIDKDVDGSDASTFKTDFGRTQLGNPCPEGR